MFEVTLESVVLLAVVGIVIALSSSPRARETLLTIFGILGFGLIALSLVLFVWLYRSRIQNEVARVQFGNHRSFEVRTGEIHGIQLSGFESLPVSKSSKSKEPASKTVVAKKPAISSDSTPIEELPLRPAEPIRIDDQTRAEIEQQWREGELHDRLRYTGTGAATLMCLLATMFGYLKLDMLSQAKYRRGLQAGAAGVILTVALVAALAAEGRLGF
jgi:hypothetical protein